MIQAHKVTDLKYFVDYAAEWLHYKADLTPQEQVRVAHWVGSGAAALNKTGAATETDLLLFEEIATKGRFGSTRLRSIPKNHAPGIGITFSPPKSVSLLWGLNNDQKIKNIVLDAHLEAADKAFSFLEREVLVGRRGAQGRDGLIKSKAVAMNFLHLASRNQDPQIHSHIVLTNCVLGADGRWSAMHNRGIFKYKSHADAIYFSHLQKTLTEQLGVAWTEKDEHHNAEVVGISQELINEFSTRRAEILAVLEELGIEQTSDRNTVIAELTRKEKDVSGELSDNYDDWIIRAREHGFKGWNGILNVTNIYEETKLDIENVFAQLNRRSSFTRLDLVREIGRNSSCLTSEEIESEADRLLASDSLVQISEENLNDDLEITTKARNPLLTTRFVLETEKTVLAAATAGQNSRHDLFTSEALESTAEKLHLTDEQKAAFQNVLTSNNFIDLIEGAPGAGKTNMLRAVVDEWRGKGGDVIGMAVSARAAAELGFGTRTDSDTIAKHLLDDKPIGKNTLIIIDEASMIDTVDLANIIKTASKRRAKVILTGDPRQLGSIDAGGVYKLLCNKLGSSKLLANNRQTEAWMQKIVKDIREGRVKSALESATQHGIIHTHETHIDAIRELVSAWNTNFQNSPQNSVLLASKRSETTILNRAAQFERLERNELGKVVNEIKEFKVHQGDYITITKNDRHLGIKNGERYVVAGGTRSQITLVALNNPKAKVISIPKSWTHLELGYALTIHKSQGATYGTSRLARELALQETVDHGWVGILGAESLKNESILVACSRSADQTHIALCKSDYDLMLDDDSFIDATTSPVEKSSDDLLAQTLKSWEQTNENLSALELMEFDQKVSFLTAEYTSEDLFQQMIIKEHDLVVLEKSGIEEDLHPVREDLRATKRAFQKRSRQEAREIVSNRNFDPFWIKVLPQPKTESDLTKQLSTVLSIQNCMRIVSHNRQQAQEMVRTDRETLQNEILRLIDDPLMQKQNLADLIEDETFNQIKETAKQHHLDYSVIHRIGVVYAAAGRVDKFEEVVIQSKREGADVGRTAQNLRDVGREIYEAMEVKEVVLELALTPGWNLESILAIRETLSSLNDSNSQGFSTQPQADIDNNFSLRL